MALLDLHGRHPAFPYGMQQPEIRKREAQGRDHQCKLGEREIKEGFEQHQGGKFKDVCAGSGASSGDLGPVSGNSKHAEGFGHFQNPVKRRKQEVLAILK